MPPQFSSTLSDSQPTIIDGGLGTALELRGINLDHDLWSADLLRSQPDTITEVHREFIDAGAQIVTTASYQASPIGFARGGISTSEGIELMTRSVEAAQLAVGTSNTLVAGSIGPYGAALGDGSEYTGDYSVSRSDLTDFHRARIDTLVTAGVDVLAIETQPKLCEIDVILDRVASHPTPVWVSVTLRDGRHMADGSSLQDLAQRISGHPNVAALGVNCVAPSLVTEALAELAESTTVPLIAYPNSGETYNAETMQWSKSSQSPTWPLTEWRDLGVRLFGGCCRTTPANIESIAQALH